MGRRRSKGDGGLGVVILILIGLAFEYWQYIAIGAVCIGVLYALAKLASPRPSPIQTKNPSAAPPGRFNNQFQISLNTTSTPRKGSVKENVKFYEKEEIIKIAQFQIPAYLLCVGQSPNEYPHLVDPKLSVWKTPDPTFSAHMGYWPSYNSITPADRATYLSWLADGRKASNADLGLVFLYFYGLEFRAIVEKQNHREILRELVRLFKIYSSGSGSFCGYCSDFICLLILKNPTWETPEYSELLDFIIKKPTILFHFRNVIPILTKHLPTHERAALMFLSYPRPISKKLRDQQAEIVSAFQKSLSALNSNSFQWTETATNFQYRPATSLRPNADIKFSLATLSEPSMEEVSTCWEKVLEEFTHYERLKQSNTELSHLFVPDGQQVQDTELQNRLKIFLDFEDHKICEVSELTNLLSMPKGNLTVAQAKTLSEGLERFEVSVEPDARITKKGLKTKDRVILVKRDLSSIDIDRWNKVVGLFDLCMAVASGDGTAEEGEVTYLLDFLIRQFNLSGTEALRITYRGGLLKDTKISVTTIAKKVSATLTMDQGNTIAKFLFSIAALDGRLEADELNVLEKAYKAFGFPDDTLNNLITEFSGANSNLVVLKDAKKSRKHGSSIPKEGDTPQSEPVILSQEALQKAFADAHAVSNISSQVFSESEEKTPQPVQPTVGISVTLTDNERSILAKLASQAKWTVTDVEAICREAGIMYGGFLIKINDYFELLQGAPVLEEDGSELCIAQEQISAGVRSA